MPRPARPPPASIPVPTRRATTACAVSTATCWTAPSAAVRAAPIRCSAAAISRLQLGVQGRRLRPRLGLGGCQGLRDLRLRAGMRFVPGADQLGDRRVRRRLGAPRRLQIRLDLRLARLQHVGHLRQRPAGIQQVEDDEDDGAPDHLATSSAGWRSRAAACPPPRAAAAGSRKGVRARNAGARSGRIVGDQTNRMMNAITSA